MTENLSERMSRMGDVVSANHYSKEVEALEVENQTLKEQLENDKIPDCIGKYGEYLDCTEICFYNNICSLYSKAETEVKTLKAKHHPSIEFVEKLYNHAGELEKRLAKAQGIFSEWRATLIGWRFVGFVELMEKALGGES